MQIIPFEPAHLRAVTPQAAQSGFLDQAGNLDAAPLAAPGLAFSAVADGKVVGCAGVVVLWPGVGQAWAVLSDGALAAPVALTRAVLGGLTRIADEHGLARIQATVAEDHHAGARWLAFLGFELEGLLVNYGPGGRGDYWMYGRTT